MPEMTDDDLSALLSRPSLRERASRAAKLAREEYQAELDDEYDDVVRYALNFLREKLELTDGELSEIEFKRGMMNNERVRAEFKCGGFEFHAFNKSVDVNYTNGGEKVTIKTLEPMMNARLLSTNNWQCVTSLVDLGTLVVGKVRP